MVELAEILALWGASAVVLAMIAWAGDQRRARRKDPDRVGFVPWTPIFFLSLVAAIVLLGLAARAWMKG